MLGLLAVLLLAAPAQAAFPGGNGRIAFARDTAAPGNDIWTMDSDGGNRVNLTAGTLGPLDSVGSPAWSPDGERIAFNRLFWPATFVIYTMRSDGTDLQQVTAGSIDFDPTWSPDGSRLAFARCTLRCDIWVVNSDGTGLIRVAHDFANESVPAWSPDGSLIAFARDSGDVWVIKPDGSDARLIVEADGGRGSSDPSWAPDGSRIAYTSDYDIFTVGADGGMPTNLTASAEEEHYPAWSPDGQRILFTRAGVNVRADIWVMDTAGTGQQNITDDDVRDAQSDWQPIPNRPPDCATVRADPSVLWPPNHKLRTVTLSGATDPDGDALTLEVTDVAQDEPAGSEVDSQITGASVELRAERDPKGDGRVYTVRLKATDVHGASCTGTATVSVPRHNR